MEEKERYIIEFAGQKGLGFLDKKTDRTMSFNDVCNLLNQQDKEIEDLKYKVHLLNEQSQNNYEKYVQVLKDNNILNERIKQLEEENTYFRKEMLRDGETFTLSQAKVIDEIRKENQQLEQQLHDLPKQIVEEIKEQIIKDVDVTPHYLDDFDLRLYTRDKCIECLATILKKYGGEDA